MTLPSLPPPPGPISAANLLARMLDAIVYRYECAVHGADENWASFRACESAMTVGELTGHIYQLSAIFHAFVTGGEPPKAPEGFASVQKATLANFRECRARIVNFNDAELGALQFHRKKTGHTVTLYNFVHGPLADALTHIGQLTAWRRQAGTPVLKFDYFEGLPPG